MITVIDKFRGKYVFLSNFFPCWIEVDNESYPSVEHAYQAMKTANSLQRAFIRTAPSAFEAKERGRKITIRDGWDEAKVAVMKVLVTKKFQIERLGNKLLATGDAELIEGNYWKDTFWGKCNGEGENHLGKILMEVRCELRRIRWAKNEQNSFSR